MLDFTYVSSTEIIFGSGAWKNVGQKIAATGAKNIMLHYGGSSAEKSGLLSGVRAAMEATNLHFVEMGGVRPNPVYEDVCAFTERCRAEGIDFILAVGGGSVIDSAKSIATAIPEAGMDLWKDAFCKGVPISSAVPIGVILTIAAAGSENSPNAVLTKLETKEKRSIHSRLLQPRFAILDPELTYTLPRQQTACGVTDILMHTLERYITPTEGNKLTERLAEAVLKNTIQFGPICLEQPSDYTARSEIMWTGALSHCGLTGLGAAEDWGTHQLGHALSAIYDYPHGMTLAAVWGSWARYAARGAEQRFVQYARNVWGIDTAGMNGTEAAEAGIKATEDFFRSLRMPTSLVELTSRKLSDSELRALANSCTFGGTRRFGTYRSIGIAEASAIYSAANN